MQKSYGRSLLASFARFFRNPIGVDPLCDPRLAVAAVYDGARGAALYPEASVILRWVIFVPPYYSLGAVFHRQSCAVCWLVALLLGDVAASDVQL